MKPSGSPDSGISDHASTSNDGGNNIVNSIYLDEVTAAEEQTIALNEREEAQLQSTNEQILIDLGYNEAYRKLNILLEKSNVYAELILARMNQEQERALKKKKAVQKAVLDDETSSRRKSQRVSSRLSNTTPKLDLLATGTRKRKAAEATKSDTISELFDAKMQYEQGINGILADEMGLGKTIQSIALFSHFYAKKVPGPFLVAGPLSTLPNWFSEFSRFAPTKCGVRYLVIDEGHRVKNNKCKLLKALRPFQCSRLLMTGTPLQNNLAELWSLLNFLLPEIFTDLDWFESFFAFQSVEDLTISDVEERERQLLTKLHAILKPFLLRRVKSDVELHLPKKREIWVYAPMTSIQLDYYKATVEKYILQMCGKQPKETNQVLTGKRRSVLRPETLVDDELKLSPPPLMVEQSLNAVRFTVMLLRKICLHPYLVEYPLTNDGEYLVDEQLLRKSGKLLIFDRLVTALIERKHKILVFTQFVSMINVLHDYCFYRQLQFCRLDGSMSLETRQEEMSRFASDPEVNLFVISTKAGGLGLNLTTADTVIIFDSDWNPQGDLQAQDRCHRIGQEKPVVVYRLICRGTIDERIVKRAATKRKLEKMVIHAGKFEFSNTNETRNAMTSEELRNVLRATDYNQIWEIKDETLPHEGSNEAQNSVFSSSHVISEKDLAKLLDRKETFDSASNAFKVPVEPEDVF